MIIPSSNEGVEVCSESRDKDVVHTKEVNDIRGVKQTVFLQRVKNIMVLAGHCNPDITPKSLYSRKKFQLVDLDLYSNLCFH